MLDPEVVKLLTTEGLEVASIQFSRKAPKVHVALTDSAGTRFKGWSNLEAEGHRSLGAAFENAMAKYRRWKRAQEVNRKQEAA